MRQNTKEGVSPAVRLVAGFLIGSALAFLLAVLVSVFNPVESVHETEVLRLSGRAGLHEA